MSMTAGRSSARALRIVVMGSSAARRARRLPRLGFRPAGEVEPGQALVIVEHLQPLLAERRADAVARLQLDRHQVDEPPVDELALPLGPGVALAHLVGPCRATTAVEPRPARAAVRVRQAGRGPRLFLAARVPSRARP